MNKDKGETRMTRMTSILTLMVVGCASIGEQHVTLQPGCHLEAEASCESRLLFAQMTEWPAASEDDGVLFLLLRQSEGELCLCGVGTTPFSGTIKNSALWGRRHEVGSFPSGILLLGHSLTGKKPYLEIHIRFSDGQRVIWTNTVNLRQLGDVEYHFISRHGNKRRIKRPWQK